MAKKSSCKESFNGQAPVHHTQPCCNSPAPAPTASFWWGPVVISDSATLMSCQKWACVSYIRVCLKCIRQSRLQSAAGISHPSNFYRLQTNGKHKSENQRVQVTFYIFSLLSWFFFFFLFISCWVQNLIIPRVLVHRVSQDFTSKLNTACGFKCRL